MIRLIFNAVGKCYTPLSLGHYYCVNDAYCDVFSCMMRKNHQSKHFGSCCCLSVTMWLLTTLFTQI